MINISCGNLHINGGLLYVNEQFILDLFEGFWFATRPFEDVFKDVKYYLRGHKDIINTKDLERILKIFQEDVVREYKKSENIKEKGFLCVDEVEIPKTKTIILEPSD